VQSAAERVISAVRDGTRNAMRFVGSQPTAWKVTAGRGALGFLAHYMLDPYLVVYVVGLGLTATQFGAIRLAAGIAAAFLAPFVGGLPDRWGLKRIYLVGLGLMVLGYLFFGLSGTITFAIVAFLVSYLGERVTGLSCGIACANSLSAESRATAMCLCETVSGGAIGMLAPLLGGAIVTASGGVGTQGIRPLFLVAAFVMLCAWGLVWWKLPNLGRGEATRATVRSMFSDLVAFLTNERYLKGWLAISCLMGLVFGILLPFTKLYAHEIRGAGSLVLGGMTTGFALSSLILGYPVGRHADRWGRKRVILWLTPLLWVSCLLFIFARGPVVLVFAATLQGFVTIRGVVISAMHREIVARDRMGKWLGLVGLCFSLSAALGSYAGGLIWDHLGPVYVFVVPVLVEVVLFVPLLVKLPETLHLRINRDA